MTRYTFPLLCALCFLTTGCMESPQATVGAAPYAPGPSTESSDKEGAGFVVPSEESAPIPTPTLKSSESPTEAPEEEDLCVTGPNKHAPPTSKVYYGTQHPTYVPLTTGQIHAIGTFHFCSGTLITPRWVLTAEHCNIRSYHEFCIGTAAGNPNVCIGLDQVIDYPYADLTLVKLSEDARDRLPGVEAIPLLTESMDDSWKGRKAEAAGYGQQETGYSGEREFTAEPIAYFSGSTLTINGEGVHGVCFGDSGGPVMVVATDGSARVAGTLSGGDSSCLGYDHYTRVDLLLDWIEGHTGPTVPPGPQPCGSTTHAGQCDTDQSRATWCNAEGLLENQACTGGAQCSWSNAQSGFRCVTPEDDACSGLTWEGACDGNTLRWCGVGGVQARDCGACGETCVPDSSGGFQCVASECGDVAYQGTCEEAVLTHCTSQGEIQTMDCSDYGDECGYVNHIIGSWCVESNDHHSCGELGFYGYCDGTVINWCNREGVPDSLDCADRGQDCGWVNSATGYYCTD